MAKNQDKKDEINLTKSLEELNSIVTWFDEQEDVDVEAGLEKVREAAKLIKVSKSRLAQIENEFKEIEKEIGEDIPEEADDEEDSGSEEDDEDEEPDNTPF
tara:strand:- start:15352 stop:15654 length:303 start_codon:yes stop_codon:yes gene_type:complete